MQKHIIRRPTDPDTSALPDDLHPSLKKMLANRHVSAAELDYGLHNLLDYNQLAGMKTAVALLAKHIVQQSRIVVVADFDADGATSCTVVIKALQWMGAKSVHYVVPDRQKHGYGLSPVVAELAAQYQPQLLITVDNGIAAHAGVLASQALGMEVLVTDHHLIGASLPEAEAILNPNLDTSESAIGRNLAGVGVAFYLMVALRAYLREKNWFQDQARTEPNLARLLDLVALGTVADLVILDYTNRILVAQGLARMRKGLACAGINALCEVSQKPHHDLVSSDLGFYIGPRLNAAGRMKDMHYGIDCLLSEKSKDALEKAQYLDRCNRERRDVETDIQAGALDQLSQQLSEQTDLPLGLCLFDAQWHPGVLGIVASRIKEKFYRPTIILTQDSVNPDQLKGSARSIAGVHIRDVLADMDSQHPGLISQFGGHAMAAGLSFPARHLQDFQDLFADTVSARLGGEWSPDQLLSDGELNGDELNLDFAELLRNFAPWGQQFPEPVFDGEFRLLEYRSLSDGKHLKLLVQAIDSPDANALDAIVFNTPEPDWLGGSERVNLAYRLNVNEYRGRRNAQLLVLQVMPSKTALLQA